MGYITAMIPLRTSAVLGVAQLEKELAARWPDLPQPVSTPAAAGQLSLSVGESDVVIATMGAPIPWPDLEPVCQASQLWPNAGADLRHHQDHLIVAVRAPGSPIDQAKFLTQVCAGVIAACQQALGVFWFSAGLLVPAPVFLEFATVVMPEILPLHLWIDVQAGLDAGGKVCGFTRGLAAFGHREIEAVDAQEPWAKLRERLYDLAGYVLENGPIIADGDTVGDHDSERILVVYGTSQLGGPGEVMHLRYQQPGKRKWKLWGKRR